jgi:cytidine deaminase
VKALLNAINNKESVATVPFIFSDENLGLLSNDGAPSSPPRHVHASASSSALLGGTRSPIAAHSPKRAHTPPSRHSQSRMSTSQSLLHGSATGLLRGSRQSFNEEKMGDVRLDIRAPYQQSTALSAIHHAKEVAAAQLIYSSTYSGLQSFGASGMTILEELIDVALGACEKSRNAGQRHHARGAALLGPSGKVYTGCDVYVSENDANSVTAERVAVLTAVSDGVKKFEALVIASDTMQTFPVPHGNSREFLRTFGNYPVILVNSNMEMQ